MTSLITEDHGGCESANIERGLHYIEATPRHLRGPAVPALKAMGLTVREACEVVRIHGLKLARSG